MNEWPRRWEPQQSLLGVVVARGAEGQGGRWTERPWGPERPPSSELEWVAGGGSCAIATQSVAS